jgi:hypothetical protein
MIRSAVFFIGVFGQLAPYLCHFFQDFSLMFISDLIGQAILLQIRDIGLMMMSYGFNRSLIRAVPNACEPYRLEPPNGLPWLCRFV